MTILATCNDFTLREPTALGALLHYDWRLRTVLTDAEVAAAVDQPAGPGVLRQLQRLGFVRALHGVRPQGGRMRLWSMEDVLKVQIALTLRAASGLTLAASADLIARNSAALEPEITGWRRHLGAPAAGAASLREGDLAALQTSADALTRLASSTIARFIDRNRFDAVAAPAFLL